MNLYSKSKGKDYIFRKWENTQKYWKKINFAEKCLKEKSYLKWVNTQALSKIKEAY